MALREEDLYQDPLVPFTFKDTMVSMVLWPMTGANILCWLVLFLLLDRTVMPATRMDGLARFANRVVSLLAGVRVKQHGLEHLAPGRSYIFCLNHVSLLDTPVMVQSIPFFTRAFQDVRHFSFPVYGTFCKMLGQLPVGRGNQELNDRSYAEAMERLGEGHCFAVFPEGHRSRDGRLGEFYDGAFRVAIDSQSPVVPVVSRGLRNLCPAQEWRFRPGKVDVIFGEPIPTEGMGEDDLERLARTTRQAMNDLLVRGA